MPELAALLADVARLDAAKARLEDSITRVMVTEALPEPRETRILPRGNWMDDSGAVVEPAIPEFMGTLDTGGRRATRLDLANWLVSPQNTLTARAFANRTWRQFFGTGLTQHPRRLRLARRVAVASGSARLARRRIHAAAATTPAAPRRGT